VRNRSWPESQFFFLSFKKSFGGGAKIFKIEFNNINREAENALLKLLEEPPVNTYFLIYTTVLDNIAATLRSRLIPIWSGPPQLEITENTKHFIQLNFIDKLDFFSKIKDGREAKNLILGFMEELRKTGPLSSASRKQIEKLDKSLKLLSQNIPLSLIGLYGLS